MILKLITFPFRLIIFVLWFIWKIISSSWSVLRDVGSPGMANNPRIVRMQLDSRSDFHVAMIGSLITLTPGTLTLGVVDGRHGRRALIVHTMYDDDDQAALASLKHMEYWMLFGMSVRRTA